MNFNSAIIFPDFTFYPINTRAGNGMCHNLLVKSSSEKVIVVEVADVSSKAAKGKDLVEAKLKYEHLLSINKGESKLSNLD